MSFSIQAAGRVSDTIKQIEGIRWVPENVQAERVRNFLLMQLDSWPTDANAPKGVVVEASGHADNYSHNLTLTIRPLYLGVEGAVGE